jgi:hypothetical protein
MRRAIAIVWAVALVAAPAAFVSLAAPTAADDSLTVTRQSGETQGTGSINVLANDSDPDGDPLTVSAFNQTSVEGGTVSCTETGDCTYTDPGGPPGSDSFQYTLSDGTATDTATVFITIENAPTGGGGGGGGGGEEPHTTEVTLSLSGHLKASGKISVPDGFNACKRSRIVKILRKKLGLDEVFRVVAKVKTRTDGTYAKGLPDVLGSYKAKLPRNEQCRGDASRARRYSSSHPDSLRDGDDSSSDLDISKVTLDRDDVNFYFTIETHDGWEDGSLTGGRRFAGLLRRSSGYWSVDVEKGKQAHWLLVFATPCSGSPGSGGSCDYGAQVQGQGYQKGSKTLFFWVPKAPVGGLTSPIGFAGFSSGTGSGAFDWAPSQGNYEAYRP